MNPSSFNFRLYVHVPFVLCFLLAAGQSLRAQQTVSYPDFSQPAGLQTNGAASIVSVTTQTETGPVTSRVLRLTPNTATQVGSAWYANPLPLAQGFSTTFRFQLTPGSGGGDGFAFVIQNGQFPNGTKGNTAVGPVPGSQEGFGGSSLGYQGLTNSLAVEFDTFSNSEFADPNANHVAIQSCGPNPNTPDHSTACAIQVNDFSQFESGITLADGAVHTVNISLGDGVFNVTIDNQTVLQQSEFSLGNFLTDTNQSAYVGFTAATGAATDNHDILSWNFSPVQQGQTVTLGPPGTTTTFRFNTDTYKITPINNAGGEQLTVTPTLLAATLFPTIPGFPNEKCIPYGDYSSQMGTDTCVEFEADCHLSPANLTPCNFLYTLAAGYDLPASLPNGIGGPDLLVAHGVSCSLTSSSNAVSIFVSYQATVKDPTTRGASRGPSCFVTTYTPGAPPITNGSSARFKGFNSPVANTELNKVKAGAARPLSFQLFDILGNPVTNLALCNSISATNTCTDPSVPAGAPWIYLSTFAVACPSGTITNLATDAVISAGNSGLQNQGGGNYQIVWKTQKSWQGACANVSLTFSSGLIIAPATIGFQFN